MKRVLVIDDDRVVARVLAVMLGRAGYEVDLAEDGLKGIELWETGVYSIVLMDVQMPRLDGLEAARKMREMERQGGGHTPIVAVTAYALHQDQEECIAAGMDAYISKPVDFRKLLEMIERLIA